MLMPFIIKKLSDHGTGNLLVARTSYQVSQMMGIFQLSKEKKEDVFGIYLLGLQPKLLRCFEILTQIKNDIEKARSEIAEKGLEVQSGGRAIKLPSIMRLQEDAENFLYSAKSCLREIARVFLPLFGQRFSGSRFDKVLA